MATANTHNTSIDSPKTNDTLYTEGSRARPVAVWLGAALALIVSAYGFFVSVPVFFMGAIFLGILPGIARIGPYAGLTITRSTLRAGRGKIAITDLDHEFGTKRAVEVFDEETLSSLGPGFGSTRADGDIEFLGGSWGTALGEGEVAVVQQQSTGTSLVFQTENFELVQRLLAVQNAHPDPQAQELAKRRVNNMLADLPELNPVYDKAADFAIAAISLILLGFAVL